MFIELDQNTWDFVISRDLRVGPPNSGKTQSFLTNERPCYIVSFPGEKGVTTLPVNEPGIKTYVWKEDDITKGKPGAIIKEVTDLTTELITGKRAPIGPMKSFCGDGLHKLYSNFWLREFNHLIATKGELIGKPKRDGTVVTEEDFKLQAYGNENYGASRDFMKYVTYVYESNVPHVTFTCWEGMELDTPELKSKSDSHILPDFPGKLAKRIMGEFAIVLYASLQVTTPVPNQPPVVVSKWQLKPGGKVWGAGIKIPPEIAKNIPKEITQDWGELKKYLTGEKKLVFKAKPGSVATPARPPITAPLTQSVKK